MIDISKILDSGDITYMKSLLPVVKGNVRTINSANDVLTFIDEYKKYVRESLKVSNAWTIGQAEAYKSTLIRFNAIQKTVLDAVKKEDAERKQLIEDIKALLA